MVWYLYQNSECGTVGFVVLLGTHGISWPWVLSTHKSVFSSHGLWEPSAHTWVSPSILGQSFIVHLSAQGT